MSKGTHRVLRWLAVGLLVSAGVVLDTADEATADTPTRGVVLFPTV